MYKLLTVLFAIICLDINTQSQTVIINDNCKAAYTNILSLKFDDAQKIIDNEKNKNPENVFVAYLENYIDFLKVTISENEELFDQLEPRVVDRIDIIGELSDTSIYKKYLIGNINLQWATARVKFSEYATAALQINKAYRLLTANQYQFPDFMPNTITLGVLHIIIGIVPDSYTWILNLISMQGDVPQGQNELKTAYETCEVTTQYNFLIPEVLFYMGMINLSVNPDPNFGKYLLSKLNNIDDNNLLLTYLAINTNMKIGNNTNALNLFSTIDSSQNYYPFYYLNYLHGECFLRNMDAPMAQQQFNIFLTKFTGENYIKDAWQKTGWASLIAGDTVAYRKAMINVLNYGNTTIDADKNAEQEAKSKMIPNIELLKSRLLFDGGYYDKALIILNNINSDNLSAAEKAEVNYRLGRIAQSVNNYTDAINYYKLTIKKASSLPEYYAGNSALKLGNIYEIENNKSQAMYYYNVCLDLNFTQYRNSIRAKAKQGIRRMKAVK